jgi:hypothetical protein
MDADDISLPERLAEQVAFLEGHPDVVLVGTAYEMVDPAGRLLEICAVPTRDADIRRTMFFETPFGHGTVMMRRDALQEAGGYRESSWPVEDYDLWRRIVSRRQVANLPHVLYRYLVNPDGICARQPELQARRLREVLAEIRDTIPFTPYDWRRIAEGAAFYRTVDAAHGSRLRRRFLRDQYVLAALEAPAGSSTRLALNLVVAFALDPLLGVGMASNGFSMVRRVVHLVTSAGFSRSNAAARQVTG